MSPTVDHRAHRDGASDAVVFFEHAYESFQNAQRATTAREMYLRAANVSLRLAFAGDALVPTLTRAFRHNILSELPASRADSLTICIWDGASTATALPQLPFEGAMVTRRGDLASFNDDRIALALDRSALTLSILDTTRNLALFCTPDASKLPPYESAAPLKTILFWWLRTRNLYLVHAGAVGTEHGGVLLVGKGGSGKSTSALAALVSNMSYVGDDYCVVTAEPAPFAYTLYNSAKVTPTSLELVPSLHALVTPNTLRVNDKSILFLDGAYAEKIVHGVPLKAILLPRVTRRPEPRLVPTTPNAALSALAISTLLQLPNAGSETLGALETLTHQLACYILELGDAQHVPVVLTEFLAR